MFLSLIRKTKPDLYRQSLELFPRQISDTLKNGVWTNAAKLRSVKAIVINGMGGSHLAPAIIASLLKKELKLPVLIDPGYDIAGYVTKDTAYIVSSYSGTTEEPLAAYKKAKARGALVIAVTAEGGNTLSQLARKDGAPLFEFPTSANPSRQPRLGLGASMASFILVFKKLGALKNSVSKDLAKAAKKRADASRALAVRFKNREIVLMSGPLFEGNLETLRNQINESAKNVATHLILPDLNHHSLESLSAPKSNRKRLAVLCIDSALDDPKVQKRAEISKEIFRKQGIPVIAHRLSAKTVLEQGLELLQFGSWLSYHLAIQNRVDPSAIPWVDRFKKQLAAT